MKIVVIGSGISGLTSGLLYAKNKDDVIIFEQSDFIGGVTSLCHQNGFSWEQGPLLLGDFLHGEKAEIALRQLGIELEVKRACRGIVMPDYEMWFPDEYQGPYWRKDRLKLLFPNEIKGIDKYYHLYDTMLNLSYINSLPNKASLMNKIKLVLLYIKISKYKNMSAKKIMDYFFKDNKIKALFTGILADVCVAPSEFVGLGVPFFNIETAFDKRIPLTKKNKKNYVGGYGYIKGGVEKLVESLASKYNEFGGVIKTNTTVKKIRIENKKVLGIELDNGEFVSADMVIASGGGKEVFYDLVGKANLDENYLKILQEFHPMDSVFMVHLGVDFNPLDYQKTALCYYYGTYDIEGSIDKIRRGIYHEGKEGFLVYVPSANSPEMAPLGFHCITIYTVAPDEIKNGDWETDKEKYAKQLIDLAEKYLPGLSQHIVERKIMTPLDYRKLAHLKKSAFGGIVPIRDVQNPPHKTPVDGLIFVGQQSENGGSVSAVLMGAIDAFHLAKSMKQGDKK